MTRQHPTILQIIPKLDTGGAELSTVEITEAIVKAGGRALVVTEGGRLAEKIRELGGKLILLPAAAKNPFRILANAGALARLIREEGVDLIHARSRAPAWSGLLAARRTGRPFVTTYHGAYSEKSRLKRLYNSIMARGDVVIANSRYTAGLIRQRYGTPYSRIRVIYRGVEGGRFDPGAVEGSRVSALRHGWGLKEGDRIVLQAARLTGWKGQSVLIEAARLLARRGALENVALVLAGDDQGRSGYVQNLKSQIHSAGLETKVHLVGHVDDMPAAFKAAFVAVVASTEPEAFGRAATEAQVMACPTISTNIGAPPETVRAPPAVAVGERTGWLVPASDAAALAGALAEALALSEAERAALGSRARAHVLRQFSVGAMQHGTLEVYDTLLGSSLATRFQGAAS